MQSEIFDYFSLNFEKDKSYNQSSATQKENLYDKYFEKTEKISSNPKYIKKFLKVENIIGRKFLDEFNEIKYLEIFKNPKLELLGISSNITFLHLYDPKLVDGYDKNKIIGFRYYEKGPQDSKSQYFTLINRFDTKYYILEKNDTMKDINNQSFLDKELNCFNIIDNIIGRRIVI